MRLIGCLPGAHQLVTKLIYDSDVRLMKCLLLRIKGLEYEWRVIIVRDSNGTQGRVVVLPDSLVQIGQQLEDEGRSLQLLLHLGHIPLPSAS